MKTVIDAVNELKGECDYYENYFYCGSRINKLNSGVIQSTLKPIYNTSWDAVCTRAQFLATVAECETNFGECILYAEYKTEYARKEKVIIMLDELHKLIDEPAKELGMDIDWSKAPDGATHYNPSDFVDLCKYYKLSGDEYVYFYNGRWESSGASKKGLDKVLIKRPQPTLIYTQEMTDNGVLPSVGMECEGKGYAYKEYTKSWFKLEVLGVYNGQIIAKSCSEANQVQLYSEFKPLTPPKTDKEKLIEEFQNALHDAFGTHTADDWSSIEDIASDLFDSFLIQPLTVEVK